MATILLSAVGASIGASFGGTVLGLSTAVIGRATMLGMQFHPEKSQATGLRMIANFLRWMP